LLTLLGSTSIAAIKGLAKLLGDWQKKEGSMRFSVCILPGLLTSLLVGFSGREASAASDFAGVWSCSGTYMSIDDDEPRKCNLTPATVSQTELNFKLVGRVTCPDGTNTEFLESDHVKNQTLLDDSGNVIGTLTNSTLTTNLNHVANKMNQSTTISVSAASATFGPQKSLHIKRDVTSDGVPLFEMLFDCK